MKLALVAVSLFSLSLSGQTATSHRSSHAANASLVRAPIRPSKESPSGLTPVAQEAARVSAAWRDEKQLPVLSSDGRVVYNFGAGLATVVCAPLRLCIVELEPGEKILGPPQIGDSVRWNISPAIFGDGDLATNVIVIKPQQIGLDTNLLITTDRRAYYMRLQSRTDSYVSRVAFRYPDDDAKRFRILKAASDAKASEAIRTADLLPAMIAIEKFNFGYRVKASEEYLRPVRVFDDGSKTYLQMSPNIINREAPALVVIGNDGKPEMVNYRVKNQTYIVDRLFDKARLVLGSGRHARKVDIIREPHG